MTWTEHLRANGASDEEIKILDSPAARKAFDKLQADVAAATEAGAQRLAAYEEEVKTWNDEVTDINKKAQAEAIRANAEAARTRALILNSQDAGLKEVAASLGIKRDEMAPPPGSPAVPANFDASKYITRDDLASLTDRAGDGLAALQDMVLEHAQLFPDRPLNVREIRKAAVAARQDVYTYWENQYKVGEARTARAKSADDARLEQVRKEEREKVTAEFADRLGNPALGIPAPSMNPFAPRKDAAREGKQPWQDGDRSALRVQKVLGVIAKTTPAN
jgi:hypothetical protein